MMIDLDILALLPLLLLPPAVLILLRQRRLIAALRAETQANAAVVARLERDVQALCEGVRHMGDNLFSTDRKIRRVSERQDGLDLRSGEAGIYKQAIDLARRGANAAELVDACGLRESEAELILLMHRDTPGTRHQRKRLAASA